MFVQPRFAGDLFGKWCVGTLSSWDASHQSCDKLKISDRFFKAQEAKKHRIPIINKKTRKSSVHHGYVIQILCQNPYRQ